MYIGGWVGVVFWVGLSAVWLGAVFDTRCVVRGVCGLLVVVLGLVAR